MLESDSFALGDRQLGGAVVHGGPVEGRHQGLARVEVQRLHGRHGTNCIKIGLPGKPGIAAGSVRTGSAV